MEGHIFKRVVRQRSLQNYGNKKKKLQKRNTNAVYQNSILHLIASEFQVPI